QGEAVVGGAELARRRAARDRAQVGAGAEVATGAGEDGDARAAIGIEGAERVGECARRRPVDGVAHLGAIDRHGPDLAVFALVDANCRRHGGASRRKRAAVSAARVSRSTPARPRGFARYHVAEKLIAPRIIRRAMRASAPSRPSAWSA